MKNPYSQVQIDAVNEILDKVRSRKKQGISGLEMCIIIINLLHVTKKDKTPISAKELWNSSSTGELWHIYAYFAECMKLLQTKKYREYGFVNHII